MKSIAHKSLHVRSLFSIILYLLILPQLCLAIESEKPELEHEHIKVEGHRYTWLDTMQTASEGRIEQQQLKERPFLRPGEILESVPGLITTQHSGTGKANQFFLRGFNLDHGTDFATSVDGVPINMPSHAHGQGYTDINFLIPEAIGQIDYGKGPYSTEYGDFSGAGHVNISSPDRFDQGLVKYNAGNFGYQRFLLLDTQAIGEQSDLSYAFENTSYTGPWTDSHEDLRKKLGYVKFVQNSGPSTLRLNLMHYDARWNSSDQIPARSVEDGTLSRLGTIDDTTGGITRRQSLALSWQQHHDRLDWTLQIYGIAYALNLWSNSSYFLDDPVHGDQFEQEDRRNVLGAKILVQHTGELASLPMKIKYGVQERRDFIAHLGLYKSELRQRLATRNDNAIDESSTGLFVEQELALTAYLRSFIGLRHDILDFKVKDQLTGERAAKTAGISSPKFGLVYQAIPQLNLFANIGQSFHSNHARAAVSFSSAGSDREEAPGLIPARGYELGANYDLGKVLRMSLALWRLSLDSELIFVGDAATTEASRSSRRQGADWMLQFYPIDGVHLDLEASWAEAKYDSDPDHEGRLVEGALPFVGTAGLGTQFAKDWSLSARLRHFGRRPLLADGSVYSAATSLVNLRMSYEPNRWELSLDALNILNSKAHDIDYFYQSQLQNESSPVADLHYHPVEPAMLRGSLAYKF